MRNVRTTVLAKTITARIPVVDLPTPVAGRPNAMPHFTLHFANVQSVGLAILMSTVLLVSFSSR